MADDSGLTEIVRRAAQANAKLYKGWMDLSFEYMRGLSEIFGGAAAAVRSMAPTQEMDSGPSTLVFEGEAGTTATGSFLVSNDLDRPLACKLVVSDFTDPTGASLQVRTMFDPAGLELAAGEQKVVQVAVAIDETLIAGVGYAGEIGVAGMDGFAVPVVVRRQHTLDDTDPGATGDIGNADGKQVTRAPPPNVKAAQPSRANRPAKKAAKRGPAKNTSRRR